ncbi:MAG TPA: SRPBCC family protein [Candidatus Limnocylindria bacterium]|nr:SRPBCC family protein [Candidatus Limnocylindria bacterium]
MPTIRIATTIDAPPERCFDLARDVGVHLRSTGGTGERAVGGVTSGLLELGDEVTWEARHLGLRQRLTARISRLERPHLFEDVMVRGTFASLHHVHEFVPRDGGTTMIDTFTFASPLGPVGAIVDRLFLTGYMRRFLVTRARELKRIAEAA